MAEKLTDKLVREEQPPAIGAAIVWDSEIGGFGLRTTAAGTKSFILNYRVRKTGVERRMTIGRYPVWTMLHARKRAAELRKDIDGGEDPRGTQRAERTAPDVNELCERYLDEHAAKKRESSRHDDRAMIEKLIKPAIGKLKVASVSFSDVDRLHRKVTKGGAPYRANRIAALLSKMFSLAIKWDMRVDNPVKGVERNQEQRRSRYLSSDELQRLTAALATHPNQLAANAIRLLLLTGARRGEVLGAKWDQFDISAGVWTKPSAHTKQNLEHRVPLSAAAALLLAGMKDGVDASDDPSAWVFPGRHGEAHLTDIKKAWASLCKTAGIKGCRMHDLRHTYASILASAGLSLPIIGSLLGHTQPGTTQRYAHLFDDPLRQATDRVGAIVTAAAGGRSADVHALADGRRRPR